MRYPVLLVADPHFTSNPRDEYRWGLWPWMRNELKTRSIRSVVFLGDLSDAKDFHPGSLVNRLALEVKETSALARLYFIPGNHEWLKRGEEFWRFLSHMGENIHYFTQPSDDPFPQRDGPTARFLPFTKTPAADWRGFDFSHYDMVFMHQTVKGSRSSNGEEMSGEDVPLDDLLQAGCVFSGDIHVPQRVVDGFEYVGSPYHVHFGDSFRPRCLLLRSFKDREDLRFPTISRVTLDCPGIDELAEDLGRLRKGDQVKVRMRLLQSEAHEWKALRRQALRLAEKAGVSVHGMEMLVVGTDGRTATRRLAELPERGSTPQEDVIRFVRREGLGGDALDAALEVIES